MPRYGPGRVVRKRAGDEEEVGFDMVWGQPSSFSMGYRAGVMDGQPGLLVRPRLPFTGNWAWTRDPGPFMRSALHVFKKQSQPGAWNVSVCDRLPLGRVDESRSEDRHAHFLHPRTRNTKIMRCCMRLCKYARCPALCKFQHRARALDAKMSLGAFLGNLDYPITTYSTPVRPLSVAVLL